MDNDLIDDQLISPSGPQESTWMNASGLIVLWLCIVLCVIYHHYGDPRFWAALGVVAIGTYCFYVNQRAIGLGVLLFGLVLGQFGLLYFSPFSISFFFGGLEVNMLLVAIMILLVYTNPDVMRRVTGQPEVLTEEDRQEELDLKSRKFQTRFQKMSTTKLEKIVTDKTLVPAALRAAEIILLKRKEGSGQT